MGFDLQGWNLGFKLGFGFGLGFRPGGLDFDLRLLDGEGGGAEEEKSRIWAFIRPGLSF